MGRSAFLATIAATFLLLAAPEGSAAAVIMYGGNGNGSAVTPGGLQIIDQSTGAGVLVGDPVTPGGLTGISFNSAGELFGSTIAGGSSTSLLVRIDPDTGALLGTVGPIGISIGDLAFQPGTDVLYGIRSNADGTSNGGELYTIDTTTGAPTLVGDTGAGVGGGIAFAPDGTLYQTAFNSNSDFTSLNTLDPTDASRIDTVPIDAFLDALAVRPTDGTIFTSPGSAAGIFTLDPVTGDLTPIGATAAGSPSDLAFRPEAVPVPPTAWLLLAGVASVVAGVRRRRNS